MGHMINRTASAIIAGNATDPADGPQTMKQLMPSLGPGLGVGSSQLIGSLFPQRILQSGKLLDEEIGNGFALITSMSFQAELVESDRKKFEKLKVAVLSDAMDELESWFKSHDIGAVLLRPDRYILGVAETSSDLTDLLIFLKQLREPSK
jgi:3-(3-hydroxy-phenyl)propionate hydroxylase